MKLLVTGANGQLGRCLLDRLADSDDRVVALGRDGLDITDRSGVNARVMAVRPDIIVNAAAYTSVDRAETDRETAWAVNAEGVEHLARAANRAGAALVHVSTDYVFDGTLRRPYLESDMANPVGVYGASKLAGEQAARLADRHLVVRTAWLFSEYGHNFLRTMIRLAHERDTLSIVDDQVGTPTYAGDLAEALVALCRGRPESGVYHFSGGEPCSWFGFTRAIFAACSQVSDTFPSPRLVPIASSDFPAPVQRPAYSVLDGGKLRREAGVPPGNWRRALVPLCRKILPTG